eukprot:CCRYP_007673-RA/>CCRYP_007673-RA protein AED:0.52 eAED:0.52 QI:0/0/0/0.5/1/1/2/0/639
MAKFGKHITDPVLPSADGSDFKSINEWTCEDLLGAIRQGADRPTNDESHARALKIFTFSFNFQSKIQVNYDSLNAKAGQLKHMGILLGPSIIGFILLRQVEKASTYKWGRDLRPAIQTLRQKYPYNHTHDAASIAEMLTLFAGADAVRNLVEAPTIIHESALAVDFVSQLLNERDVYSNNDSATNKQANLYSTLPQYAADPPTTTTSQHNVPAPSQGAPVPSTYKCKAQRKYLARQQKRLVQAEEEDCIDRNIQWAEDELTSLAKTSQSKGRLAIDASHNKIKSPPTSILQNGRMAGCAFATTTKRICHRFHTTQHVQFHKQHSTHLFSTDNIPAITYDSGADGHYLNEDDRRRARLPILRPSTKHVAVANGQVSTAKHESSLPFEGLSQRANKADTFDDFPQSLMSVGKVSDDGTISVFTKDGVTVQREDDVLITCKGAPIFIGVRDHNGRYRVPLIQNKGHWQPRIPTKKARQHFEQANSVYDLPSTEQAIKWMHAVCGYPVKSTWLKAIKAGNFMGWPLLTEQNVKKYYPETTATPKGHLNQSRKNVRSTETKPFKEPNTSQLRGRKNKDVYIKVYDVRETVFTDQTGQFPTRSQSGNKYIMVMVDIDSSGILVPSIRDPTPTSKTRWHRTQGARP